MGNLYTIFKITVNAAGIIALFLTGFVMIVSRSVQEVRTINAGWRSESRISVNCIYVSLYDMELTQ